MSANTQADAGRATIDPYLQLMQTVHPLRPIRTPEDHQKAKKALRSLSTDPSDAAVDFKAVLVALIEHYERRANLQLDTSDVSPGDVVQHLLDERQMTVADFAAAHGVPQPELTEMLSGQRDWSTRVIVKVADALGVNRGLFLR